MPCTPKVIGGGNGELRRWKVRKADLPPPLSPLPVERPREQAEDAAAFCVVSQRGLESARLLAAGGRHRTPAALAARCRAALAPAAPAGPLPPGAFDWCLLAAHAGLLFRIAPGASCALGPLDAPTRGRAGAAPRARRATPPPVAAPSVRDDDGGGDRAADGPAQETDARMAAMYGALLEKGDAGARVVAAVLDHSSFATTVENLFALSFLVRDQQVAVSDAQGGLVAVAVGRGVPPAVAAARAPDGDPGAPPRQFVLAYTMEDWEAWKRAVGEGECLMAGAEVGGDVGAPSPPPPPPSRSRPRHESPPPDARKRARRRGG
jgi:hypothetical protein